MRGNYKVRVRIPIFATAEVERFVFRAENETAAINEARETIDAEDVANWFRTELTANPPYPSLADVIEFEATETDEQNPSNERGK